MFIKDQWMALRAIFAFSSAAQERYAEGKFAPHSEKQMIKLAALMDQYGFPGEKLIGTGLWATTILSHHNSISEEYVSADLFYPSLQTRLRKAILNGEMSPYDFALLDNWYRSVKSGQQDKSYGILDPHLSASQADQANKLRNELGIRTVELHNQLVEVQETMGMDFYLEGRGWLKGKIQVTD